MSEDQKVNGGGEPNPQILDVVEVVALAAKQAVVFLLRGLVASMGNLQPEMVVFGLCRGLGKVIGEVYAGDPEGVKRFRDRCALEFGDALAKASVIPLPAQQPADQGAEATRQ